MSAVVEQAPPRLRAMRRADLAAVVAIERDNYPFPWSEGVFRDCLRVGYYCRVLDTERGVGGYAIMSLAAGEAHVLNLCVDGWLRGGGHGRRLLEHLSEIATRGRARRLFLEVRPSNTAARRLYERAGFGQIGLRRGYYPAHGGREDALVLARRLP